MRQRKWVLTIAAVVLLSGLLAGCTPFDSGSADTATAAAGETVKPAANSEAEEEPAESDGTRTSGDGTVNGSMESESRPGLEADSEEEMIKEEDKSMKISVEGNGHTVVFQLVDNSASRSLYEQLPFTAEVQDYSNDEKIFYPPEKLDITDAAVGQGPAGSLAYFSSWGNVIMYYGSYGPYNGLYELGTAISGSEFIETMSGTLQIKKSE